MDNLLSSLGQGDWDSQLWTNQPSLYGVLDFFNSWPVGIRSVPWTGAGSPQTRLAVLIGSGSGDAEIIRTLFLATLSRPATDAELAAILASKQGDRMMWLAGIQWALLQKSDFVFNY